VAKTEAHTFTLPAQLQAKVCTSAWGIPLQAVMDVWSEVISDWQHTSFKHVLLALFGNDRHIASLLREGCMVEQLQLSFYKY